LGYSLASLGMLECIDISLWLLSVLQIDGSFDLSNLIKLLAVI
jgi:hypothetical protein